MNRSPLPQVISVGFMACTEPCLLFQQIVVGNLTLAPGLQFGLGVLDTAAF